MDKDKQGQVCRRHGSYRKNNFTSEKKNIISEEGGVDYHKLYVVTLET